MNKRGAFVKHLLIGLGVVALAVLGFGLDYKYTEYKVQRIEEQNVGARRVAHLSQLINTHGIQATDILEWNTTTLSFVTTTKPTGGGGGGVALGVEAIQFNEKDFQEASGATSATGSLNFLGNASSLGSSDLITISDGTVSQTFTFGNVGGGNTSVSGGTTTIDIGGGLSDDGFFGEMRYAMALTSHANGWGIIPHCDYFASPSGGFSPKSRCMNALPDGTVTSTMMYLYNANPGTAGNVSIAVTSSYFTVDGMAGGSN